MSRRSLTTVRLHLLAAALLAGMLPACQRAGPGSTSADAAASQPSGATERAAQTARKVFHSPLAGTWYQADPQRLAGEIQGYLDKVPEKRLDQLCALILPHAGYRWSGQTAAYGVKQIVGRSFHRVVVMGPSHRVPMENLASVPAATHYATPLGAVPLDTEFIAALKKHPSFQTVPAAHQGEHSVQIELPLLQKALGSFQFVPIVVGQLDQETTRRMAGLLRGLVDHQTLVVASSDFTHYGRNYGYFPFLEDVPENLKKLDMGSWERIRRKDLTGFFKYIDQTGTTICGRYAIGLLLAMLPDDAQAHLLHYDTSGRVGGDYSSSVSYLAIAFSGKWSEAKPQQQSEPSRSAHPELSEQDKQELLKLARATLTYVLENRKLPRPEQLGVEIRPAMKQIAGAFVTLHERGLLRGCIGEILPSRPLYMAVMAQAVNAGLNDPRFTPVRASELDDIDFEISVLTPPRRVASADQIVIGKHGIVLEKNGRSAVYLPQVAAEQGWDLETTLTHLSEKAGLPPDAWRNDASFQVFEAIVFGEKH